MGEFAQFTMVPMASAALTQILAWGVDRIQATLSELTRQIEEGVKSFGGVAAPAANRVAAASSHGPACVVSR